MKTRLDELLVQRGLAESRTRAQALIRAGLVTVGGQLADKPGRLVPDDTEPVVRQRPAYVGRGAEKLIGALDAFSVSPDGKACLDVGASTGGFTDVLLARGARVVYAVDVGRGQLAWRLRGDRRVVVMERTDIRKVEALPERVDVATIDVSFISLGLVLPAARSLVDPSAEVLCLVKPQFEVGRGQVGRGGVVRDANLHRAVLDKVCGYLTAHGWSVLNAVMSPVPGASGNREFWLLARPEAQRADAIGLDEVLRRTGLPQGG